MIHFFIGTKAQFIKMAPVMVELEKRGVAFRYIDSGQHAELTRSLRKVFGLREPDVNLYGKNQDVVSLTSAIGWIFKLGWAWLARRKWLREHVFAGGGICLIHGDTLSTLFGMMMAKAAGLKIGHVEAGLRSFCIWHPFPEELIRIHCMKRCDILFTPSEEAKHNLEAMKVRGRVIKVDGNTVVDALRLMENTAATIEIPKQPFALATCHRVETITRAKRLQKVVSLLNSFAEVIPVLFVIHTPTLKYLKKFGLKEQISPKIRVLEMQNYLNFAALLKSAKLVLADGGSIQEECAYLNKPCLILRNRTERSDGLGRNARLWGFENAIAQEFLLWAESLAGAEPEQWIKEGKYALNWTRLSCHDFTDNQVRLQLFALAYNLGNFLRRLALPKKIKDWLLRTLQVKLIKIGAKVIKHSRYVIFQMAEVMVSKSLFHEILERIHRLKPVPIGYG